MPVSAVTNNNAAVLPQSNPQSTSPDASASTGATSTANSTSSAASTASTSSTSSATESSTQVTLSPEAQVLAGLNAKGVTETVTSLAGLNLPSLASGESSTDYAQQLAQALNGITPIAPPTKDGKADGYISQSAFETVVAQFGGSKTQADQLYTALGGGNSVSNGELLGALAGTTGAPNTSTEQDLLKLMDSSGDGTVSSSEFLNFETAMVAAEKPAS